MVCTTGRRRPNGPCEGHGRSRRGGVVTEALAAVRAFLPRGDTLDDETFAERHRLLSWLLALHVPAIVAFAVFEGFGVRHGMLEVAPAAFALWCGHVAKKRRVAAFFVTAGLVFCSSV